MSSCPARGSPDAGGVYTRLTRVGWWRRGRGPFPSAQNSARKAQKSERKSKSPQCPLIQRPPRVQLKLQEHWRTKSDNPRFTKRRACGVPALKLPAGTKSAQKHLLIRTLCAIAHKNPVVIPAYTSSPEFPARSRNDRKWLPVTAVPRITDIWTRGERASRF